MAVNKITIDGTTNIDLSTTGIETAADIPAGKVGYLRTGERVTGTGENMSNPLSGKILAVNGDSICAGERYAGGYAGIIGTENNMTVQNIAESGATIATGTSASHIISTSISDMRSDADYVILEGGINDSDLEVTLGALTSRYDDTYNTTTFAGAFEEMLRSTLNRFPTAKIGYIFVHKCNFGDFKSTSGANSYYGIAKAACEKWGIPYCDLNTLCPPIPFVDSLLSYSDGVHPTEDGYRLFYVPKITAWMKGL